MQYTHKQDVGVLPPQGALNLGKTVRSLSAVPFFSDSGEHRRRGTLRVGRLRVQPLADTFLFERPTVPGTVSSTFGAPGRGLRRVFNLVIAMAGSRAERHARRTASAATAPPACYLENEEWNYCSLQRLVYYGILTQWSHLF